MISGEIDFPPAELASPEGLLAIGGSLTRERLISAYCRGIFPWYSEGEPVMWWSPDPRLVLYPEELRISRSLKKTIKKRLFRITMNRAFEQVMAGCAGAKQRNETGTWISPEMIDAYCDLHAAGYAHSVESWIDDELVGGLYGVSIGNCFFGESMFSIRSDASKVAFVRLVEHLRCHSFRLIDCQVTTDHMIRFGAREISRKHFMKELSVALDRKPINENGRRPNE